MKFLMFFSASLLAFTQTAINYTVKFTNLAHHEIQIEVEFKDIQTDDLNIVFSRTSPGRYALHEFVKNVYSVTFRDKRNKEISYIRPNLHEWNIPKHDGYVKMTYTLFGDRADGTYSGIDETHVHLNIPASFAWARGMANREILVNFPDMEKKKWKLASQLVPTKKKSQFKAKDLYYFLDSPIEVSDHDIRSFKVNNQSIKLAVHHDAEKNYVDEYVKMIEAVVLEQEAVFGELANFDFGEYVFLACYLPHVNGDGMEHRNSTILTSTAPLSKPMWVLGTVSHEFFHSWNVERIRPKSLEPFNFEDANMSGELWFAEGFTSYYDGLFIKRADLMSEDDFVNQMNYPINTWVNGPAVDFYSAVEMSQQAPFVDAAKSVDPQNKSNTFFSYYSFGNAIALLLDMEIRSTFPDKDLDGYMKSTWLNYGKNEIPYTNTDLMNELTLYTGDKEFSENFFKNYIFGKKRPDYKKALENFGYILRLKNKDKASLGSVAYKENEEKNEVSISSSVLIGTAYYKAGVEKGDIILKLNKNEIQSKEDIEKFLDNAKIGKRVTIEFKQRGVLVKSTVEIMQDKTLEVVRIESTGKNASDEQLQNREKWLNAKSAKSTSLIAKECETCKREFPYYHKNCFLHADRLIPKIK